MDAITLLKDDHRTVEQLFTRYEGGLQGEAKREVVEQIIRELSVHAAIEEQVLYPAVRRAFPTGEDLAEEGIDEHQEVKETLAELDGMDPDDSGFDQRVRSLIADVRHHVEEEEGEMFPKLAQALSADRLDEMGSAMEGAKAIAPTRPHPRAPSTPPGNIVAGPVAGAVDRARDAVSGRAAKKTTARATSARKKTTRKKSTGRKKTTRKKSTGRKKTTTGRKTTARKKSTPRKKTTARKKSTPRKKTTARKKSTPRKKTTARKSTGRKTSARTTRATRKSSTRKKTSARKSASSRSKRSSGSSGRRSSSKRSGSRKPSSRRSGSS